MNSQLRIHELSFFCDVQEVVVVCSPGKVYLSNLRCVIVENLTLHGLQTTTWDFLPESSCNFLCMVEVRDIVYGPVMDG